MKIRTKVMLLGVFPQILNLCAVAPLIFFTNNESIQGMLRNLAFWSMFLNLCVAGSLSFILANNLSTRLERIRALLTGPMQESKELTLEEAEDHDEIWLLKELVKQKRQSENASFPT